MRVIAGIYKRRVLVAPKGDDITRPTSDRVKENLFNIIAPHIEDATVLDLFAGSGALGIEALSRGAQAVTFVENNKSAIAAIKANIIALKIPNQKILIVQKNVDDFLASTSYRNKVMDASFTQKFDIVFADPPYQTGWPAALNLLEKSGYCSSNCLFIWEKQAPKPSRQSIVEIEHPENWTLQDMRKYGKTLLEFWRRNHD